MRSMSLKLSIPLLLALVSSHQVAFAETVLKFATFVPPQYVLHKPIFQKMADDVAERTGGEVKIRIYPSGELGKGPREQYVRAVRRVAEITMGVTGYTSSIFPKTLLIELPNVASGAVDATEKLWKVLDRYLVDEYKKTKVLALYATPPSVLMTTNVAVRSPDDLKGLKIRAPSKAAGDVLSAYGATPLQMPANKVYTAMNTGVIDGALMGSDSLLIFKLLEPTKYVTVGVPEMVTALFIVMNEQAWDELAANFQSALASAAGRDLSVQAASELSAFGEKALKLFSGKENKTLIELSPEDRAKFDRLARQARTEIIASMEKEGVPAGEIVDAMTR